MFLIINEFDDVSQIEELVPEIIEAIDGGVMSVFRWNEESNSFEQHNGVDWDEVRVTDGH